MDRSTRERLLLARPAALLARLGRPERRYRTVLVAGTKGKGSTAAMLAGMLHAAGHRTGLYSQPHLHTYRERIRVGGVLISSDEVSTGVARIRPHAEALEREQPELGACTTYELGTALALDHFARAGCDVAVLEVGLGGRLDATNLVDADLAVITSISYDHTAILGETLPEIAGEKAGIVKPGRPALSAPQRPQALAVLEQAAAERRAPLGTGGRDWTWSGTHEALQVEGPAPRAGLWPSRWRYERLRVPLLGAHQLENAATAVAAAHVLHSAPRPTALPVPAAAIVGGLAATRWPARFEVVRGGPTGTAAAPAGGGAMVVVDGAHNGDSAAKLAAALGAHVAAERLWLVLGAARDKDLAAIVAPLAPLAAGAWAVASRHPRSRDAATVAAALRGAGVPAQSAAGTPAGLAAALAAAGPRDVVCVTGSLFVAAEAREALGLVDPSERDPEVPAP
jgi:dihydrofolate synthase/folylpolyglutamate synthase